jgi:hypothetical protein
MFAESLQGPHEKRLLHTLLDHYNVLERPVMNESDPLQLSFGLTLMQIIDVVSSVWNTSVIIVTRFWLFEKSVAMRTKILKLVSVAIETNVLYLASITM